MSKFIICPKLVELSVKKKEYWLHVLIRVTQVDSYKVVIDKTEKLISEYSMIPDNDGLIKVWMIMMAEEYGKNYKKVTVAIPDGVDIVSGIVDFAKSLNKSDRVILTDDGECYFFYNKMIERFDVKVLDRDESKEYLSGNSGKSRITKSIIKKTKSFKDKPMMSYLDFLILITHDYSIRASSEQGDERGELNLNLRNIKLALKLIEKGETDGELIKELGNELYKALFPDKINAQWHAIRASAEAKGNGVRLRINCELPEVASLPWEFLYDETTNTFICNDPETAVSRYLDVPKSKRTLGSDSQPLKVLLVISSPNDQPKLDIGGEETMIREALATQISAGQVELDVVREATISNLMQQLRLKNYNVFHFIGHGDFLNEAGVMALVETDGSTRLVNDEDFANLFLGTRTIGLVVLNSCLGAKISSCRAMTGVAPRLVQRGLPAVVAMQYPISDTTAKKFAYEFYRTLALGWPVDSAIQTTRNAISIEIGTDKPNFATPVLFMRAKDGVIMSEV